MPINRDGDRGTRNSASVPNTKEKPKAKRFMTPKGRMAFVNLLEPTAFAADQKKKYSVILLFPPESDLRELREMLDDAMSAKFGHPDDWPVGPRVISPEDCFIDAGTKKYTGFVKGWTAVKFTGIDQPGIVDAERVSVTSARDIYAGRWARVTGGVYAYDNRSKGCAFGLNNVQLLAHDDTFSGRPQAEDEFDDEYADDVAASDARRAGRSGDSADRGGGTDDLRGASDRGSRYDDRDRDTARADDHGNGRDRGGSHDNGSSRVVDIGRGAGASRDAGRGGRDAQDDWDA